MQFFICWLRSYCFLFSPTGITCFIHYFSCFLAIKGLFITLGVNMSSNFFQCLGVVRKFVVECVVMASIKLPWNQRFNILSIPRMIIHFILLILNIILNFPVSFILGFIVFLVDNLFGIVIVFKDIISLVDTGWTVYFWLVWFKSMHLWEFFIKIFSSSEVFC